jgi:signal peptidase
MQTDYYREQGYCPLSAFLLNELLFSVTQRGALFRFRAHGSSMYPFIRDGDVLTLSPINGKKLSVGEVVAFHHPCGSKLAIHRIIGIRGRNYCMKGDNLQITDGIVSRRNILAKVVSLERSGKVRNLGLGIERLGIVILTRFNLLKLMILIYRQINKLLTLISTMPKK